MRKHLLTLALLASACTVPATAVPQPRVPAGPAVPMFVVLPQHAETPSHHPAAQLTQWNGSFTDLTGKTVTYTMVGTDPTKTNKSTTTKVLIIPVKMVYGIANGDMTFDPLEEKTSSGRTVVKNIIASPLFSPGVKYVQGGTSLGKTQYEDAFQRGNFWSTVKGEPGYHVLLSKSPTVEAEQTIDVEPGEGSVMDNPFGSGVVGTMDIDVFDELLQTFMQSNTDVNAGLLPVFITYDIYLTEEGQCCIGGYHSALASQPTGQTYSYATYVDSVGAFAQDVSALSHELGEWTDDPFVDNDVNCTDNSLMEVGDPLEGGANYGAYPYKLHNFSYNLQSLVFIGYFGAPPSTSLHSWLAFQNDMNHVCPGQ